MLCDRRVAKLGDQCLRGRRPRVRGREGPHDRLLCGGMLNQGQDFEENWYCRPVIEYRLANDVRMSAAGEAAKICARYSRCFEGTTDESEVGRTLSDSRSNGGFPLRSAPLEIRIAFELSHQLVGSDGSAPGLLAQGTALFMPGMLRSTL